MIKKKAFLVFYSVYKYILQECLYFTTFIIASKSDMAKIGFLFQLLYFLEEITGSDRV